MLLLAAWAQTTRGAPSAVDPAHLKPVPQEWLDCTVCHGSGFGGNKALGAPALAGLPAAHVSRQLQAFRSGTRGSHPADTGGALMRPQAMQLSDADIRRVAEYLAGLPVDGGRPATVSSQTTTANEDTSMQHSTRSSFTALGATAALSLGLAAGQPATAEVRRHALPGSDFPIAQAVEVLPGTTLVYHSGMTPRPANPDAEQYSAEYWGDTEAQTLSVFARLEESLTAKGLTFGDVIKMQVFLVAPEAGGSMDFAGMMRAYRRYFGTEEQPNLPARSAFQVAGLAAPGMLVEIEVVLARP
jgi:enamine deaminase RidA (YjgF/YER057c/UK114 family)